MIDDIVQVDDKKLVVETIIAEGGFGYVYKVHDEQQKIYALKKITAEGETKDEVENEINILKSLQGHPHIMEYISHNRIEINTRGSVYKFTYLILCEFCDRGTLQDLDLPIPELERSCRILYQLLQALKYIHSLGIIHRDIKAENVLFDSKGHVKLCDFGSATRRNYKPDLNWTPLERATVEEEMQRHTTPLYRAPEILETYNHYPINCAIDIWAFGCLTYYIRFGQHAFPDSGKLSIVNCCYSIPKDIQEDDFLVSIVRKCLKSDPEERISISALIENLKIKNKFMDLDGSIIPFTPSEVDSGTSAQDNNDYIAQTNEVASSNIIENEENKSSEITATSKLDLGEIGLIKKPSELDSIETLATIKTNSHNIDIDTMLDMKGIHISDQNILSPKKMFVPNNNNKRDPFDDLLESFGTTLSTNGVSSTQQHLDTSTTDGLMSFNFDSKNNILAWRGSRRGNIRALLSSLHLVLSDDFRWKPVGMHQLVTDSDVKRIYRLACLAVHPDKVAACDDDTKEIANMIFMELNEAWSKFEGK